MEELRQIRDARRGTAAVPLQHWGLWNRLFMEGQRMRCPYRIGACVCVGATHASPLQYWGMR
jgi:hypothetical protein